jgi:NAD(P)-dependent dehydrogenase (short-subunit alcohol dehydrogenase family)
VELRVTDLEGKVVVVTGGARGMGAAYVRGFLSEGAKVVATDRSVVYLCAAGNADGSVRSRRVV